VSEHKTRCEIQSGKPHQEIQQPIHWDLLRPGDTKRLLHNLSASNASMCTIACMHQHAVFAAGLPKSRRSTVSNNRHVIAILIGECDVRVEGSSPSALTNKIR
jgi:hypothetical protein